MFDFKILLLEFNDKISRSWVSLSSHPLPKDCIYLHSQSGYSHVSVSTPRSLQLMYQAD
jgi:hypothetical protein